MSKIKFTDISEKAAVKPNVRAKASKLLAIIVDYGIKNYNNTKKMRDRLLRACNIIIYSLSESEPLPHDWLTSNPLENMPEFDDDKMIDVLRDAYLSDKNVEWDLKSVVNIETPPTISPSFTDNRPKLNRSHQVQSSVVQKKLENKKSSKKPSEKEEIISPTPKTDLYLQCPKVPQFDKNSIWMQGQIGYDKLIIYESLPKIPTKQNEISVTTDITKMTDTELMRLYPNCLIKTRHESMYAEIEGLPYDDKLGVIFPIANFTEAQIRDNIIKYPHLYKLTRLLDGQLISFYSSIELNGELHKITDVWDDLPESKVIPKQIEFIKEYVARRYLLERDILEIAHNYPLFGTLDPYLTLFMSPDEYIQYGYKDTHNIVIQCVNSRVSFKRSRNPVIRRLLAANE